MDDKFLEMGNFHIPTDIMKDIPTARPVYHNYLEGQMKQMDETMRAIEETRAEKEAEELRRHEELVDSVKQLNETIKDTVMEALKMGASVNIDSNTGIVNLSMNSQNVQQQATQTNGTFDYQIAESTLEEISEFLDLPKFQKDFGEKADEVKQLIAELRDEVKEKKELGLIKRGFTKLKELVTGVEGSLIATAIWEGAKKIPGLF